MTDKFDETMRNSYVFDDGFRSLRERMNEAFAEKHGERIAYRAAHNGQPNGYKPISEAELQREKLAAQISVAGDTDAAIAKLFKELEPDIKQDIKIIADPNFGKIVA